MNPRTFTAPIATGFIRLLSRAVQGAAEGVLDELEEHTEEAQRRIRRARRQVKTPEAEVIEIHPKRRA